MNIDNSLILKIKWVDHLNHLMGRYQIDLNLNIFEFSDIYKKEFLTDLNKLIEQISIHQLEFEYRKYLNDFYYSKICSNIYSKTILNNLFSYFSNLFNNYITCKWNYVRFTSDDNTMDKILDDLKERFLKQTNSLIKAVNTAYFIDIGYSKYYNGNLMISFVNYNNITNKNCDFVEQYIHSIFIIKNNYEKIVKSYDFNDNKVNLLINKIIEHIYETGYESPIFECEIDNIKKFKNPVGVDL